MDIIPQDVDVMNSMPINDTLKPQGIDIQLLNAYPTHMILHTDHLSPEYQVESPDPQMTPELQGTLELQSVKNDGMGGLEVEEEQRTLTRASRGELIITP